MNSCLYETEIRHRRLIPKEHHFAYRFFSFYLDLDEIDSLSHKIFLMSRNRGNVYAFYDRDHLGDTSRTLKENVLDYLRGKGVELRDGRIMLLTYLRTFGYVFNPVSFYFCFDKDGEPRCVLPEIGNTFGEIKPFLLSKEDGGNDRFSGSQDKYYYISPFTKLDDTLDFKLTIPGEMLDIIVDTSSKGEKVIVTSMRGKRIELTNGSLLGLTVRFPFVTVKVITLIHLHAFLLWLKKIPFEEKTSNFHLQKEVHRVWYKHNQHA